MDHLEIRLQELQADVRALEAEVGHVPRVELRGARKAVTDRLHKLENDDYAARYAESLLDRHRSTAGKVAVFAISVAAVLISALNHFGVG